MKQSPRKATPALKKNTNAYKIIAGVVAGIFIGFFFALYSLGDMYSGTPRTFAVSSGANASYIDLYDGEMMTITFEDGENLTIGNVDSSHVLLEVLDKEISYITEHEISTGQIQNLVGEAAFRNLNRMNTRTTQTAGQAAQAVTCRDSDNGRNYGQKGTVERGSTRRTDYCFNDGKSLQEFSCNRWGGIASSIYDCSKEGKVCSDGRCVTAPKTAEEDDREWLCDVAKDTGSDCAWWDCESSKTFADCKASALESENYCCAWDGVRFTKEDYDNGGGGGGGTIDPGEGTTQMCRYHSWGWECVTIFVK